MKAALEAQNAQGFVPDFIVIDTLARSMSGAEENVAKDMSRVFELLEIFRAALNDASILVVHHTTKDGLNYRGSSVIKGAVDAMIESKAIDKGPVIALTSAGFKNVADFETFQVRCEAALVDTDEGQQQVLAIKESITGAAANATARQSCSPCSPSSPTALPSPNGGKPPVCTPQPSSDTVRNC